MVEVARCDESVSAVVARASEDQDSPRVVGPGVDLREGRCDGEARELHELVHAEPKGAHEI